MEGENIEGLAGEIAIDQSLLALNFVVGGIEMSVDGISHHADGERLLRRVAFGGLAARRGGGLACEVLSSCDEREDCSYSDLEMKSHEFSAALGRAEAPFGLLATKA
jgi:hypothetical protein